ncbi:hypothetical protein FRD00_08060 [Persicimonas caeni]|nr:hypothetical protein [Persicimonas caeni]QED31906.1 hypothetical protein FRD00_08060 [Persicimonas caeni]
MMTRKWLRPRKTDSLRHVSRAASFLLLLVISLTLGACGVSDEPDQAPDEESVLSPENIPTPEPGPRQFPAPQGRFFDHDQIVAVNPDPSMRKDMRLTDNFYWLADEHAEAIVEYSLERLVFPLEGHRELLGYKPGHIIANKFAMVRHYINEIRVEGDRIIFETRPAKIGEFVKHGNFFLHIKPGAEVPLGLDALDPYLYDTPQALMQDVREHMNSRLIREQIAGLNPEQLRMATRSLNNIETRQQPLQCSYPDAGGSEVYNCDTYIRDNPEEFRAQNGNHNDCVAAGNWKYEASCKADIEDNADEYIPDNDAQEPHQKCIQAGNTKTNSNGDPICVCTGLSVADCIEQQCDKLCECTNLPDGNTLDHCIHHVCKDECNLSTETVGQDQGDAASGSFGGSLSFCLNTDTNPNDSERCPGDIAIKQEKGYQLGPNVLNLTIKPIFMATVGVKASFDFDIDCCVDIEAVAKIGLYGGVGYGVNVALNIANSAVNASDTMIRYWSDEFGSPIATIQVWILQLQLDPYIRLGFNAEAGLGGQIAYEYYDEHWFYGCVWFGTDNGAEFKVGGEESGSTITYCDLPNYSRDAQFNGFIEDGFNAEVGVGASVALGIELNLYGRHRTGVWFEPVRVLADLNASFRAPRCTWDYFIRFGALFGLGVDLGIISFNHEWTWTWDFLPIIAGEGLFTGGIWEDIFGCGLYDTAEPYGGDAIECATGPEGDAQCTTDLGTEARCFVRECVEHDNVRVSMGWFTPGADLDLYVRDPANNQYSQSTSYPGNFTRHDCAGTCGEESPSSRYIENAVFPQSLEGEYEIWVSLNPNSTTDQPVPYTIEVESADTRQVFSGTLYPQQNDATPAVFTLAVD